MKTGLILTGGRLDVSFAGDFLRGYVEKKRAEKGGGVAAGAYGEGRTESFGQDSQIGTEKCGAAYFAGELSGQNGLKEVSRRGQAEAGEIDPCSQAEAGEIDLSGQVEAGEIDQSGQDESEEIGQYGQDGAKEIGRYGQVREGRTGAEKRGDAESVRDGSFGFDCVIVVDGALMVAGTLGLKPTAIVGDFDTVRPEVLARYRRDAGTHVLWDVHKPEKDETDTELAIATALKLGCRSLVILGATGGRLDHELSNIHLLKLCLDAGADAAIYDEQNRVSLLRGARTFRRDAVYGKYVSFIPLTEHVRGIRLTGFKYPLSGKDIAIGREAGLCVSNEIVDETAEIRFDEGILICVESKD